MKKVPPFFTQTRPEREFILSLYSRHIFTFTSYIRWLAKAIGAGAEGAQSALQEAYYKSMTLRDAETLALRTLREVMEEKVESNNVEVAAVRTG